MMTSMGSLHPSEGRGDKEQPPSYLAIRDDADSVNSRQLQIESPLKGEDKGAGGAYVISLEKVPLDKLLDGTQRGITNAILGYTNLIAGSILYYTGADWLPLPPGSDGQSLEVVHGRPTWSDAVVSVPRLASLITSTEEKQLPNSSQIVASDGVQLELKDGAATITVDDSVIRGRKVDDSQIIDHPILLSDLFVGVKGINMRGETYGTNIANADVSQNRQVMIPDVDGEFVMNDGDQLIKGSKLFADLATTTLTINTAGSKQEFPQESGTLVNCESEQTLKNKAFDGLDVEFGFPIEFKTPSGKIAITPKLVGANRIYTLYDATVDGDIALKEGIPAAGCVAYADGHLLRFTLVGSNGLPLVSKGTDAPVYEVLTANGGGTGQREYKPGDVLYADSTGALQRLPIGQPGQALCVSADGKGIEWK